MALSSWFKKATNFLGLSPSASSKPELLDGDIIYCKNNVCVHPPASLSHDCQHVPGYLTVRSQKDEILGFTLILHWIPNASLKKNPRSIENSPSPNITNHRRQAREEYSRTDQAFSPVDETLLRGKDDSLTAVETGTVLNDSNNLTGTNIAPVACKVQISCSDNERRSVTSIEMVGDQLVAIVSEQLEDNAFESASSNHTTDISPDGLSSVISSTDSGLGCTCKGKSQQACNCDALTSTVAGDTPLEDSRVEEAADGLSDRDVLSDNSSSTSGPDSQPQSVSSSPTRDSSINPVPESPCSVTSQSSSGSVQMSHNLTFPENSVSFGHHLNQPISAKDQLCGVFSVDLGQMRSLRVFFADDACTSGQLVIASRESQYKVLHFHSGGLDRLVDILSDWKFLTQPKSSKLSTQDTNCRQFSVVRPNLAEVKVMHPEEKTYEPVNEATWRHHMNDSGQIEDEQLLCKTIFFAGLEKSLRHEMWPFLLSYYPYASTFEQREQIRNEKYLEYQRIRKIRENMNEEEKAAFWRSVEHIVEKDVVRTDRSHEYFRGDHNPNLAVLRDLLLNYAVAHPVHGYTQGMSDLLAPLLSEIQNEVDTYWCFVGLMERTIFVSSPKDIDMDKQLLYLRELMRLMVPHFYEHVKIVDENMDLLFVHRWILLCFKREFVEADALRMWEACWAHYQTDYFHLFICLAIVALYGEEVVQQQLPADEMLLHFSSLAMHMNAGFVLRKARCLLHQFRTLPTIPCTLDGLCLLCAPGMWDSGHVPAVRCVGGHEDGVCPSNTDSPS